MQDELVKFETAKLAKQSRIKLLVNRYYDFIGDLCSSNSHVDFNSSTSELYSAPTQTLLQKYLRETYNIHVLICPVLGDKNGYDSYPIIGWKFDILKASAEQHNSFYMGYPILNWFTGIVDVDDEMPEWLCRYDTYEEALEDGLINALKHYLKN